MNDMYLKNRIEKLGYAGLNWLEVQRKLIAQEYQIEFLRIKAAKYRACILENTGLAEKLDNQTKEKAELWKTLCIVYNGSEKQQEVKLLKGTWEVLADGEDSFLWKHPQIAAEHMKVSPVSILILGKKEESR